MPTWIAKNCILMWDLAISSCCAYIRRNTWGVGLQVGLDPDLKPSRAGLLGSRTPRWTDREKQLPNSPAGVSRSSTSSSS